MIQIKRTMIQVSAPTCEYTLLCQKLVKGENLIMRIMSFFLERYSDAALNVQKRAKYLLIMNSITIAFLMVAGLIRVIPYPDTGLLILSVACIISGITLLIRYGRCNLAGILSVSAILILAMLLVIQSPANTVYELYRAAIYLGAGIFISSLVTYRRGNFFIYGALSVALLTLLFISRLHTNPELASSTGYSTTYIIIVLLLTGLTAIAYNIFSITRELVTVSEREALLSREVIDQVKEHNLLLEKTVALKTDELNAAIKTLTRKNEVMTDELKMAQRVQQNIIPTDNAILNTDQIDFGCSYSAVYNVGGDLYDVIPIDETRYGFLMADVSGHGIAAALVTTMAKVSFRAHAQPDKSTAEICDNVDREMYTLIGDLEYYLTAYFCILDPKTGILQYTNCGHHPALLHPAGSPEIEQLDTGGSVLGSFKDGDRHEAREAQLHPHDRLVLFTDGIIEARNKDNQFFEQQNLRLSIRRHDRLGAQAFIDSLIAEVDAFCGDRLPDDDRAILCIDYKPLS